MKPEISIIIPTHNKVDRVDENLESLSQQTVPSERYEIIVINDGGAFEIEGVVDKWSNLLDLKYVYIPKSGPAVARNMSIDYASADIIMFLNDDVVLTPHYLAEHLRSHAEFPGHAVRGNTRWHPKIFEDEFMFWVAEQDIHYYLIDDFSDIGYEYFHTLDLSIHRKWLEEEKFSEDFPFPSLEDTELGWRLDKKGMRLIFNPRAISYHHHHYTLEQYLEKADINGKSARVFVNKIPDLQHRLIDVFQKTPQTIRLLHLFWLTLTGKKNSRKFWSELYKYRYVKGLKSA